VRTSWQNITNLEVGANCILIPASLSLGSSSSVVEVGANHNQTNISAAKEARGEA